MMRELEDKITAYLADKLSTSEKEDFEKEIIRNPELKQQIEIYKIEKEALNELAENEIKERIKTYRKKAIESRQNVTSTRTLWIKIAIAASIVFFFGIVSMFTLQSKYSYRAIAENQYAENEPNVNLTRNDNDADNTNKVEKVKQLEQIQPTDKNYLSAQYQLGHFYFSNEKYDVAFEKFQHCIEIEDPIDIRLYQEAEYYYLLSCLRQNKMAFFEEKMQQLKGNEKHLFKSNISALDMATNSFWAKLVN